MRYSQTTAVRLLRASLLGLATLAAAPLLAGAEPAVAADASASVEPAVTLYVQQDCGYCASARQMLQARKVEFTERDIADTTVHADWRALGGQGVPLLLVGTTRVQGFDPARIEAALSGLANRQ